MLTARHLSDCTVCRIHLARERRLAEMLEEDLEDVLHVAARTFGPSIDLRRQLPPPKGVLGWSADAAAYLYRRIETPRAVEVPVFFGAEEAGRIWVNGRAQPDTRASWGFHATDNAIRLHLDAGVNHVLVKVVSGERGELALRLSAFEVPDAPDEELLALNQALEKLEREDPACAALVKLRFFAGLGHGEAAQTLGLSRRTADRHWSFARAWLYEELKQEREA